MPEHALPCDITCKHTIVCAVVVLLLYFVLLYQTMHSVVGFVMALFRLVLGSFMLLFWQKSTPRKWHRLLKLHYISMEAPIFVPPYLKVDQLLWTGTQLFIKSKCYQQALMIPVSWYGVSSNCL